MSLSESLLIWINQITRETIKLKMSRSSSFLTGKELWIVQRLCDLKLWLWCLSPQDCRAVLPDIASLTRRQLIPLHDRTKLMMFRVVMSTQVVLEAHHRRNLAVV
jgi:hypothetical protein